MGNSQTKKLADRTRFDKQEVKKLRELFENLDPSEDIGSDSRSGKESLSDSTDSGEPKRKRRTRSFSRSAYKNDHIDREQFKKIFQHCCGVQEFSVDLDKIFESVDSGKKGKVSFTEIILWLAIFKKGTAQDKLKHVFQAFDTEHAGVLGKSQIENVVSVLKSYFERKGRRADSAHSLVQYLDQNKDGLISESEWVTLGEQAGLLQAILGDEFAEMMDRFCIPSGRKEKKLKTNPPNSTEGDLSVLLPELRREIFSHLEDFKAIVTAMRVNRRWKKEMEQCWYELCKRKGYLNYEDWWLSKGKNWKWVFNSKFRTFGEEEAKEGLGVHETPKSVYEGEWSKNKKSGWGRISWKIGGYYIGQWSDNCREGYGFQVYSGSTCEGDTYEGQWHKSNRDGKGTYQWKLSGDVYSGDWKSGKKQGHGVFLFAKTGNKYIGSYSADKRNGRGTFYWANGDMYVGTWYNGEKQGQGTYTWATNLVYTGGWKRNLKSGNGTVTWPNGAKFEGMWLRNRINGRGTFIWPDGDRFEGEWENNNRRKGVLYTGKSKTEQEWNENSNNALLDMKDLPKVIPNPTEVTVN